MKTTPCIVERLSSMSSSTSESEYFSSEEVDANADINDSNQKSFSKERERSSLSNNNNTLEVVLKKQASNKFEGQLKRNLELQFESQVKQPCAKNGELHNRVLDLEMLLKERKGMVSVLQSKLKNNEDHATSKIAELMSRINKLEQEAKSLRTQKGEMEEKLKHDKREALSQKKDFTEQINVMQQKLDFMSNHNKELEAQLGREREEVSQCLVRMENIGKNFVGNELVEKSLLKEKECFLARIKDLELEVESRNHELDSAMAHRGEDISKLSRELESCKEGASTHAKALKAEVEKLKLKLDQKIMLELQNERRQKEYSQSLTKMENLKTRVGYQEEMIKELTERIEQIGAENKQAEILSKNVKLCQQSSERKMEELAEEFRKNTENNIRLLHQRIHVAGQINNENKESCKMEKKMYEEEKKRLGERIASYEDELRVKGTALPIEVNLNGLELGAEALDLAAGKLEEQRERVLGLVTKMLGEVEFAKDWIGERKGEMKELKDKVDGLTMLLGEKEEQELLLREKVSKEGGEKLNLMKAVSQLERKVKKLEKNMKEKDEELIGLGEKKREAIRQLCLMIEFHRDRSVYLKDLMSKRMVRDRKRF